MADPNAPKVEGTQIDPGEIDFVFAAIKARADAKVPSWERSMVSDDLLRDVATTAVQASVTYRSGKEI